MATYVVPDWRRLGLVLRDARRQQGLTQAGLAEQAGVSRAWLAKLEAGHRRAEMEQIFRLLSALSLELVIREQRRSSGEAAVLAALGRAATDEPHTPTHHGRGAPDLGAQPHLARPPRPRHDRADSRLG